VRLVGFTATYRYISTPAFTIASKHACRTSGAQLPQKQSGPPFTPPDAVALVMEQMALINARVDAQAIETAAQPQCDAQRDTPRPVQAAALVQRPSPPPSPPFGHHALTSAPNFHVGQPYYSHPKRGKIYGRPHPQHGHSPVPGGQPHALTQQCARRASPHH
jgi:hypothetical protein